MVAVDLTERPVAETTLPQAIKLFVPGSTMLFGEHAVLHGGWGLRAAVDKGLEIALLPRSDDQINIYSERAVHRGSLRNLGRHQQLEYALNALHTALPEQSFGLDIVISSNLGAMGLGSSAAIVAGLLAGLALLQAPEKALDKKALYQQGLKIIHNTAGGVGSGADLAASLYGGIVAVKGETLEVLHGDFPMTLAYSGYKIPTQDVIRLIQNRLTADPAVYAPVMSEMVGLSEQAVDAVRSGDLVRLGNLFAQYYDCQKRLGVSDQELDRLVNAMKAEAGVSGAKIAGAGLGDCAIALGEFQNLSGAALPERIFNIQVSASGVRQIPLTPSDIILHMTGGRFAPAKPVGRAVAPVNIALVKYWGKRDTILNLPVTSSLSVTLPYVTRTEIAQFQGERDEIVLNGEVVPSDSPFHRNTTRVLNLFRPKPDFRFRLETHNELPTAAGLASSASGLAALTLALNEFFGWHLTPEQLSILARILSGSACRSVFGPEGFVLWDKGNRADGMDSHAQLLSERWPGLCLGLVLLNTASKTVSSRVGMNAAVEGPRYADWPAQVDKNMAEVLSAIREKNFTALGEAVEENAIAMHRTTVPEYAYFLPETHQTLETIRQLRADGIPVYTTMDAGPNVKVLFMDDGKTADILAKAFGVRFIWRPLFADVSPS